MNRDEFIADIREHQPDSLAEAYLTANTVAAFPVPDDYASFKNRVEQQLSGIESVSIVGSGNWRFSLHPDKAFKEFDATSDIDIAVISAEQFHKTWEELRKVHRSLWYTFPFGIRAKLRRNAEDVYSGFISPAWIPGPQSELRYGFRLILNRLQDKSVDFKPVKMLFFKNNDEAIDYYKRGFLLARRKVERNEI